jgi:hypothetical protein
MHETSGPSADSGFFPSARQLVREGKVFVRSGQSRRRFLGRFTGLSAQRSQARRLRRVGGGQTVHEARLRVFSLFGFSHSGDDATTGGHGWLKPRDEKPRKRGYTSFFTLRYVTRRKRRVCDRFAASPLEGS